MSETKLKCSECYRKWCPLRNTIIDECRFVDKEILKNLSAENIFDWWISGVSYEQWYAEKFLQQKIEFDNEE